MTTHRQKSDMPEITAWVSDLRDAFGVEEVNSIIRRGRDGEPVFFAQEGGSSYGTPLPAGNGWDAAGIDARRVDPIPTRASIKR
ncbi:MULTISPECIES: hypothetical protein [Paraburkholderia]|uniref:Uncharacterized protein n=1 Tax=Paraburkholderia madseniana TaxID=2599607 RepID=A0AAP5BLK8_9BURK|nr:MULTISPECIES: hypothetical protein [Paraburkholderia]MCX4151013.1 hypothetical protein [Paraburkholderia madseniana]MCX4176653.1 hypothetical protein [Paraburkholderia madseniana]MDN7153945.1 hypothetical protein [Paraburkholderia sp. WS6]MDQ6412827.1 hypothetical protein [Paraburkholderia madseniana]MDQ6464644.1 hypothetical protein [Paraburkholderia madseniana]